MNSLVWKTMVLAAPCVMCATLGETQQGRTYLHHVREGQGKGQKAPDVLGLALCYEHHQGASGWHGLGKRGFYQRYKLDELDLLAFTIQAVLRMLP